ncbi:MAG: hypothetical protein OXE59_09365 [Bacteroidetes bacterium]|nr:hypothetical protein [Bacteroidota bacterium]MCY4233929.1 hypothetical protein [Bacteroidota bacterium]
MRLIIKGFTLVGALLFFLCAYWQLNDPDALWWVLIYGIAAVIGFVRLFRQIPWQVLTILAIAISGFGLYCLWIVVSQGLHYFSDEVGREMMGALMVGAYLAILAIHARVSKG